MTSRSRGRAATLSVRMGFGFITMYLSIITGYCASPRSCAIRRVSFFASSGRAILSLGCSELPGAQVAQCAVGSFFIIVTTPGLDLLPGIVERHEPFLVQSLGPQPTVERFDQPILRGLSAAAEAQPHLVYVRPWIQHLADKLEPLSTRIFSGRPRSRATPSRIAATRSPVSR